MMARRMVSSMGIVTTRRDDDLALRMAFQKYVPMQWVCISCVSLLFKCRLVPVYLHSAPNVHIEYGLSLKELYQELLGSTIAVFKIWLPSSICYCEASLVSPTAMFRYKQQAWAFPH
jgi:hypothetical protein